jgi:16S rRNA processing protein RimM
VVGQIAGAYGVKGEVRVYSYTEPREEILQLRSWFVRTLEGWRPVAVLSGRVHGKGIVAQLDLSADRDAARQLLGTDIAVPRDQLPSIGSGQYYWTDLLGLEVVNLEGVSLGKVLRLMETGANDVLVVEGERERLIPFVLEKVVLEVDLERGVLRVDWDPQF